MSGDLEQSIVISDIGNGANQDIMEEYDVIYIGNVPSDITLDELNEVFSEYEPIKINICRDYKTRLCKGFCYGIFREHDKIANDIIDDKEFILIRENDRIIFDVDQSEEYEPDDDENELAVFVQGINPKLTTGRAREDIEEEIFPYCEFTKVVVIKSRENKHHNRGQAFIYTLDVQESSKVIQLLNGYELFEGYYLSCKYALLRDKDRN